MASSKRKKKKINVVRLAMSAFIVILLVISMLYIKNILMLHAEQSRLQEENRRLEQEKADLEVELSNVNDLDYIEEQARKQLKMIKPGEVLYVLNDDTPQGQEDDSDE